jgi:hypothetical protein
VGWQLHKSGILHQQYQPVRKLIPTASSSSSLQRTRLMTRLGKNSEGYVEEALIEMLNWEEIFCWLIAKKLIVISH